MPDFNHYQQLALRTYKSDPSAHHMLLNGALGIAGESGEIADLIKKQLYPSKPGDGHQTREHLIDELGDLLWYLAITAHALDLPLEEIARRNLEKLAHRHNLPPDPTP